MIEKQINKWFEAGLIAKEQAMALFADTKKKLGNTLKLYYT